MSRIDITKLSAEIEEYRAKMMKEFIAKHGEQMGRAMEAFIKTGALIRGVHNHNQKVGLDAEESRQLFDMMGSYADYMMGQYFHVMGLTQEQCDVAADASRDVLDYIYNEFEKAAEKAFGNENSDEKTGSPTVGPVH
jgi:hypothetical protein